MSVTDLCQLEAYLDQALLLFASEGRFGVFLASTGHWSISFTVSEQALFGRVRKRNDSRMYTVCRCNLYACIVSSITKFGDVELRLVCVR